MTDPIAEGVKLVPHLLRMATELDAGLPGSKEINALDAKALRKAVAALTAAGEMAGERVLLNDIRTIADSGGRSIETAMNACDKIIELIDMERQLGSAAPASVKEDVEKVARKHEYIRSKYDETSEWYRCHNCGKQTRFPHEDNSFCNAAIGRT